MNLGVPRSSYGLASLIALGILASGTAFAQPPTVTFNLTGVSGGVLGGVYTSPYLGNIDNGATIPVICDDFSSESYIPESWTAYDTNLSSLSTSGSPIDKYLRWGGGANSSLAGDLTPVGYTLQSPLTQTQEYDVAAYLITELLNPSSGLNNNDLSYAIWGLFDQNAFANIAGTTDLTNAETYLRDAIINVGSPSSQASFSNVSIYTWVPGSTCTVGGAPCPSGPQEFIVVTTPEASTVVVLGADLLGFFGLVLFLRRRASLHI